MSNRYSGLPCAPRQVGAEAGGGGGGGSGWRRWRRWRLWRWRQRAAAEEAVADGGGGGGGGDRGSVDGRGSNGGAVVIRYRWQRCWK